MARTPEDVPLWGETLCLDYVNSVDWTAEGEHFTPEDTDVLRDSETLGRWGRRLELLATDADPASGAELDRARALRDVLYRLFAAASRDRDAPGDDLDRLLRAYREAVEHASLRVHGDAFELHWPTTEPSTIRHAVATDAMALIQEPSRLNRVTRCPGRDCGWLFLNTSGRRRWCSMSTCGSREKMRRLRRAQHAP